MTKCPTFPYDILPALPMFTKDMRNPSPWAGFFSAHCFQTSSAPPPFTLGSPFPFGGMHSLSGNPAFRFGGFLFYAAARTALSFLVVGIPFFFIADRKEILRLPLAIASFNHSSALLPPLFVTGGVPAPASFFF